MTLTNTSDLLGTMVLPSTTMSLSIDARNVSFSWARSVWIESIIRIYTSVPAGIVTFFVVGSGGGGGPGTGIGSDCGAGTTIGAGCGALATGCGAGAGAAAGVDAGAGGSGA